MRAFPWIIVGVGVGLTITYLVLNEPNPQSDTGWDSVENVADRTWRWGSRSRFSGTGQQVAGRVKEGLGKILGDDDLTDQGIGDQAVGAIQDAAGKVAHAASETIHDMNV
jgi:uncharacterized protein YjbJ (UPF0337 family)